MAPSAIHPLCSPLARCPQLQSSTGVLLLVARECRRVLLLGSSCGRFFNGRCWSCAPTAALRCSARLHAAAPTTLSTGRRIAHTTRYHNCCAHRQRTTPSHRSAVGDAEPSRSSLRSRRHGQQQQQQQSIDASRQGKTETKHQQKVSGVERTQWNGRMGVARSWPHHPPAAAARRSDRPHSNLTVRLWLVCDARSTDLWMTRSNCSN